MPFEVPKGNGIGRPFVERVDLQIWWMNGTQRRSFTLQGFHRAVLAKEDLTFVGAQAPPLEGPTQ